MLPLKRSAQEKKGTLAEKPFLCYYDIYRKERRENNEKLYSGNVSEETFCKETHLGNSCGDRHGICSVMAGAGQFWNRPLHEHESCYFGQTRHESRQLAGAAQLPFIYYRDIVGTGVYRIRNACQYVPRRLFD